MMITDAIVNIVYTIVNVLLAPVSLSNFVMVAFDYEPIKQWVAMACYIIPIGQLMPLVAIFISLMLFRIAVTIIKTIWDLLPIL